MPSDLVKQALQDIKKKLMGTYAQDYGLDPKSVTFWKDLFKLKQDEIVKLKDLEELDDVTRCPACGRPYDAK